MFEEALEDKTTSPTSSLKRYCLFVENGWVFFHWMQIEKDKMCFGKKECAVFITHNDEHCAMHVYGEMF